MELFAGGVPPFFVPFIFLTNSIDDLWLNHSEKYALSVFFTSLVSYVLIGTQWGCYPFSLVLQYETLFLRLKYDKAVLSCHSFQSSHHLFFPWEVLDISFWNYLVTRIGPLHFNMQPKYLSFHSFNSMYQVILMESVAILVFLWLSCSIWLSFPSWDRATLPFDFLQRSINSSC